MLPSSPPPPPGAPQWSPSQPPPASPPGLSPRPSNPIGTILGAVVVLAILGGAVWYVAFRPGGSTATVPPYVPPAVTAPPAADTSNACTLVSDSQVTSSMGKAPISGGVLIDVGGLNQCTWSVWFQPPEYVSLSIGPASVFTDERFATSLTVSGLGQSAWWEPTLGELAVLSGTHTLTVIVESGSVDAKTAAIQIARDAMARM
jgi:hypothetical protein